MGIKPYTTLQKNDIVTVWQKSSTGLSSITFSDIGKLFTIVNFEYDGRRHNRYIGYVYLRHKNGHECRACIHELSRCNQNFEPEGKFISCVSCGAVISENDLVPIKQLGGIGSCPGCGTIDPVNS